MACRCKSHDDGFLGEIEIINKGKKSDFEFCILIWEIEMQRLDKYLANLGLVSRRECNAVCKS